jgi:FkbM family methyltransferase
MSFRKSLARLLPHNGLAFRVARKIVNLHEGDNEFDMHTNGELRVMHRVLPQCQVVFDIGANVGEWTELAVSIAPRARYHCFEPSAETFRRLTARKLPENVRRNNFGLGSAAEERTLFVFADGSGANSLHNRVGTPSSHCTEERVVVRTLDDYCAEESLDGIDFVKIDVEGHELSVMRGASRMLGEGRIGVVQFEYGGAYIDARALLKDVWDLVEHSRAEYAFYKIFPHSPRRMPKYLQTLETFQYSNWLIVRNDWIRRLELE